MAFKRKTEKCIKGPRQVCFLQYVFGSVRASTMIDLALCIIRTSSDTESAARSKIGQIRSMNGKTSSGAQQHASSSACRHSTICSATSLLLAASMLTFGPPLSPAAIRMKCQFGICLCYKQLCLKSLLQGQSEQGLPVLHKHNLHA